MVVSADVTDLEQMHNAMTQVKERFGTIHGVIHSAGIPGGGVIQLKRPEIAASVLAPKVKGTWVLEELLKDTPLDVFVLCSSTFAITSRFGQVDYCAANAFLDAFAHYKSSKDSTFTVSINWDGWQEVGMAVNTDPSLGAKEIKPVSQTKAIDHLLLDKCIVETVDRIVYLTEFGVIKHWVLDEHRIMGDAVIPGTAYLEMARAAFEDHLKNGKVEIGDVFFFTPLRVGEDEKKEVFTILEKDGSLYGFRIISKSVSEIGEPPRWEEHARGRIRNLGSELPGKNDLDEITARCHTEKTQFTAAGIEDRNKKFVYWGPRWQSLKKVNIGNNEALGYLELPAEFAADLNTLNLHPSLVDVATSFAIQHAGKGRYLPLSYKRLRISGPLPTGIYSHARYEDSESSTKETVTFDIAIMNESGKVLVQIEGMSLRRVNDAAILKGSTGSKDQSARKNPSTVTEADAHYLESLAASRTRSHSGFEGILPQEGVDAFNRVLSGGTVPQIVVSVKDFQTGIEETNAFKPAPSLQEPAEVSSPEYSHPRPDIQTSYVAPRNESEQILANIWQETLGIEQVGINDNFFELGGDSVIALLIIAKANQAGLQITPNDIFEYQTVAELATVADAARDTQAEQDRATEPDTPKQPSELKEATSSDSDEFNWTQDDLDDIARAIRKSKGDG
jgi:acyl carrier protein